MMKNKTNSESQKAQLAAQATAACLPASTLKMLAKRGITFKGRQTMLINGSWAEAASIEVYVLDDNGTQIIRTFAELKNMERAELV